MEFVNINIYDENNDTFKNIGKISIKGMNTSELLYDKIKDLLWEFKNLDFILYNAEYAWNLKKKSTKSEYNDFLRNLDRDKPTITICFADFDTSSTGGI
jgi:hypothetical protein